MVRSAIESIKQELRDCRGHHRSHGGTQGERKHKRTVSESMGSSDTPVTKRTCIRKSDGHLALAEELDLEGHSTSPSLSTTTTTTTTDEEDVDYGDKKEEEKVANVGMEKFPPSPIGEEDNPGGVAIISDSDEEGLDSTLAEDDEDDDDDVDIDDEEVEEEKGAVEQESMEGTDKHSEQFKSSVPVTVETDLQEEMRQYLPPPCPLEYAENPLLHMSPQLYAFSASVKARDGFFCI
ncbi:unnamed protein product [Hydatigera taeniaeformis]|uniref:Myelin transcription factor 1-like n=1 Tax=Hydatigena taeniaeformis TaxID=6205 RepID=A0A0R3X3R5_HYDTA|nr:unnamed protein product [Hydatigera taeniaeformis]